MSYCSRCVKVNVDTEFITNNTDFLKPKTDKIFHWNLYDMTCNISCPSLSFKLPLEMKDGSRVVDTPEFVSGDEVLMDLEVTSCLS